MSGIVVLSPAGGELAVTGPSGRITTWRLSSAAGITTPARTASSAPALAASAESARTFRQAAHLSSGVCVAAYAPAGVARGGARSQEAAALYAGSAYADASLLATGSASGAIVIWDTATGEVVRRLGDDALQVNVVAAATAAVTAGRKRTHKEADAAAAATAPASGPRHTTPVRALAWASDGSRLYSAAADSSVIIVWDVSTGAPLRTYHGDKRGVSALAVSADDATLFAALSDIHVIDLASGRKVRRLAGHSLPVTALALAHVPNASPAAAAADGFLVSAAGGERQLCVWDMLSDVASTDAAGTKAGGVPCLAPSAVLMHPTAPPSSGSSSSSSAFTLPSGAALLSVLRSPVRKGTYHISCLGHNGAAVLWRYKRRKSSDAATDDSAVRKPIKHSCIISASTGAAPASAYAEAPSVLGCVLLPAAPEAGGAPAVAVTLLGPSATPSSTHVAYLDADGHMLESDIALQPASAVNMAKALAAADAADASEDDAPVADAKSTTTTGTKKAMTKGAGTEHIALTKSAIVSSKSVVSAALAGELEVVDDANEMSLGQRMASVISALQHSATTTALVHAIKPASSDATAAAEGENATTAAVATGLTQSAASAISTSGGLTAVLSQALHSGDDTSLELCLSYSDATVITNTLSRLPATYVVPFLTKCVAKLQAKPTRGAQLIPWIKSLLTCHTGYLLSLPDLLDRLASLYTLLDSRLTVYKKLLKLSGRLDLLMAQLAPLDAAGAATGNTKSASRSFHRTVKRARRVVSQAELDAGAAMARNGERAEDEDEDEDEEAASASASGSELEEDGFESGEEEDSDLASSDDEDVDSDEE